jgi:hypothetical protein
MFRQQHCGKRTKKISLTYLVNMSGSTLLTVVALAGIGYVAYKKLSKGTIPTNIVEPVAPAAPVAPVEKKPALPVEKPVQVKQPVSSTSAWTDPWPILTPLVSSIEKPFNPHPKYNNFGFLPLSGW